MLDHKGQLLGQESRLSAVEGKSAAGKYCAAVIVQFRRRVVALHNRRLAVACCTCYSFVHHSMRLPTAPHTILHQNHTQLAVDTPPSVSVRARMYVSCLQVHLGASGCTGLYIGTGCGHHLDCINRATLKEAGRTTMPMSRLKMWLRW